MVYQHYSDETCHPFEAEVVGEFPNHWEIRYLGGEGDLKTLRVHKGACTTEPYIKRKKRKKK